MVSNFPQKGVKTSCYHSQQQLTKLDSTADRNLLLPSYSAASGYFKLFFFVCVPLGKVYLTAPRLLWNSRRPGGDCASYKSSLPVPYTLSWQNLLKGQAQIQRSCSSGIISPHGFSDTVVQHLLRKYITDPFPCHDIFQNCHSCHKLK